jgi:type II secretion system protein G
MKRYGFTLIELLIVIAILGILAVIAVPNFYDALIKSRVAKAKIDLRTLGQALQQYRIDYNMYPRKDSEMLFFADFVLPNLTTPVSYVGMANVKDPFGPVNEYEEPTFGPPRDDIDKANPEYALDAELMKNSYIYTPYISYANIQQNKDYRKEAFLVASVGPDQMDSYIVKIPFPTLYNYPVESIRDSIYHPSNGIVSLGDIGYFGGDIPITGLRGGG